jgi:hypothetical protein
MCCVVVRHVACEAPRVAGARIHSWAWHVHDVWPADIVDYALVDGGADADPAALEDCL